MAVALPEEVQHFIVRDLRGGLGELTDCVTLKINSSTRRLGRISAIFANMPDIRLPGIGSG
jgi:hypothetical protein